MFDEPYRTTRGSCYKAVASLMYCPPRLIALGTESVDIDYPPNLPRVFSASGIFWSPVGESPQVVNPVENFNSFSICAVMELKKLCALYFRPYLIPHIEPITH